MVPRSGDSFALPDAALAYAALGWPVFPVGPRGKVPAIPSAHPARDDPPRGKCHGECGRDGHGLHDATTDAEKVRAWWRAMPKANIGVRTGVAFDVLDVDAHHDGCTTLVELLDEHGCLPSGPSAATPQGGVHLYFLPTGLPNAASLCPGLDWRGAGGYVVVPPSSRAEGAYEWGLEPREFPFPTAPPWLVALHPHSRSRTGPTPGTTQLRQSGRSSSAYGRSALEGEVGRLLLAAEGERNHSLNRAAFSLGQLVAGGVLDAREVVEALVVAAERIGLEPIEIEKSIQSGLTAGMRQPRRAAS